MKMNHLFPLHRKDKDSSSANIFDNENGAIDLASIMVGIIVIGLIGGLIAATVFSVIPWAQDNAAKQQLDNIVSAESAYMGLSSTDPPSLPAGLAANSYGDSGDLAAANVLIEYPTYCVLKTADGKGYDAYAQSASGKVWTSSERKTKPSLYEAVLPTNCSFIAASWTSPNGNPSSTPSPSGTVTPSTPPASYTDPNPTHSTFTYMCDYDATGVVIPVADVVSATVIWDDGVGNKTYASAANIDGKDMLEGVTYKVTVDGTYHTLTQGNWQECLRSVDHLGMNTGVIHAGGAFANAINLTAVPEHIPSTITSTYHMFFRASSFNDPNVSKWDVSNVQYMSGMFNRATIFNQPLNDWNVSNVEEGEEIFIRARAFNQPLDKWNVSKITNFGSMFEGAHAFNQDISNWDVSNAVNMAGMFSNARAYDKPLNSWNVSNVGNFYYMFSGATAFNQPLNSWNTELATEMAGMFQNATNFNQPLNNWNTQYVTSVTGMFENATSFNQNLNTWDTSNFDFTWYMFKGATSYNQPMNNWNTANVVMMSEMFSGATSFNQNINNWNLSSLDNTAYMFYGATSYNQPMNNWDVRNVTGLSGMFYDASSFNQNLTSWVINSGADVSDMFTNSAMTPGNKPVGS